MDNETWLIEIGDEVIERKANSSYEQLSLVEQSIYCLWVLDYSVRNSGDLDQIVEIHPTAIDELTLNAETQGWKSLENLVSESENVFEFCEKYYKQFDLACHELRSEYENT